jgi:hypothetical protein
MTPLAAPGVFPCIHVNTKDFVQFFFTTTHMAHGTYNGPVIQTNPGLLMHRSHGTHRSHEIHEATTHRRAAATLCEETRREEELSSGCGGDRQKAAEQRRAAGRQPAGDLYGAASRARIGVTSYSPDPLFPSDFAICMPASDYHLGVIPY